MRVGSIHTNAQKPLSLTRYIICSSKKSATFSNPASKYHNQVSKCGSLQTGLWTAESDLNLSVVFEKSVTNIETLHQKFDTFVDRLIDMHDVILKVTTELKDHMFLVKLKLTEEFEHKHVELIFKTNFFKGWVRNEEFVIGYMKVYRHLRPLYLAFRRLLHNLELDNPLTGGINTFSTFLMIVGFLQRLESPAPRESTDSVRGVPEKSESSHKSVISGSTRAKERCEMSVGLSTNNLANNTSVGELFLKLVYYYGFQFDYHDWYIRPYVAESNSHESVFKVNSAENSF